MSTTQEQLNTLIAILQDLAAQDLIIADVSDIDKLKDQLIISINDIEKKLKDPSTSSEYKKGLRESLEAIDENIKRLKKIEDNRLNISSAGLLGLLAELSKKAYPDK